MNFLNKLFGRNMLDGDQLACSEQKRDYAQIDLLSQFVESRAEHEPKEVQRWNRVLPRPYAELMDDFQRAGWLVKVDQGYQTTEVAMPFVQTYQARMEAEREAVLPKVRAALSERDTGTALELRRAYESLFPLGQSPWTGPEPQLSHSALTRRILFLDHSLIQNLSQESAQWIKLYAAEQHLWGAYWRLKPEQIPACIQEELVIADLDGYPLESVEAVYWRAYQLALYVDNQETWQRCKGGDHVRRIEVIGPDDGYTCDQCKDFLGQEYLVTRVPDLPPVGCTSPRGCRCRYEPVLASYTDL